MTSEAKDKVTHVLTHMLFDEVILDIALEEHAAALRRRSACDLCGGPCNSTSCPPTQPVQANGSRAPSPGPSGGLKGETYYDCLNCKKPQAASRYAPHLSKCLGLTGRGRSTRGAAAASSNGHHSSSVPPRGTSASPYVSSDDNDSSYGAAKKKKATDAAKNGIRRAASPAPGKLIKKPQSASQTISNLNPASHPLAKTASASSLPSKPSGPFSSAPTRTSTPTMPQVSRKAPRPLAPAPTMPQRPIGGPGLDPPSSSGEEESSGSDSDAEARRKRRKLSNQPRPPTQPAGAVARKAPVTSMPQQAYVVSSDEEA